MRLPAIAFLVLIANPAEPAERTRAHRSESARHEFKQDNPCPSTGETHGACPGYVIDHIKPLACGGDDSPDNMQWQTVEEAKAKDKWERKDCRAATPAR
jgi:hypothetical protein